jgi:hypothetical protein
VARWRDEDTEEALKAIYQAERDPALRTHLHALWLLRCGWTLGAVRRAHLVDALDASVRQLAGGWPRIWARKLGLRRYTVSGWQSGRIPSLRFLLIVCRRLGVRPLRLVRGDVGDFPTDFSDDRSVAWFPPRPVRPRTSLDCAVARRGLEEALTSAEQPPPSLRQVAQRLGDTPSTLRHHFPELCQAISERHLRQQKAQSNCRRVAGRPVGFRREAGPNASTAGVSVARLCAFGPRGYPPACPFSRPGRS